jgi:hypothetical protein
MTTYCYVLCWRFYDNSASGVIAVFNKPEPAEKLRSILHEYGGTREYTVIEREFIYDVA